MPKKVESPMEEQIQAIVDKFNKNEADKTVKNKLETLFSNAENPAQAILEMATEAEKLPNKFLLKQAIGAYNICLKNDKLQSEAMCKDIQAKAFDLVSKLKETDNAFDAPRNTLINYFDLFGSVFKFDDMEKKLKDHVETFLSEGDYASAATLIAWKPAKLLESFEPQELLCKIIIPIFILHKWSRGKYDKTLENLLKEPQLKEVFLHFLDEYLVKSESETKDLVLSYKGFPEEASSAFYGLKQTMNLYISKFKADKSHFPNLTKMTIVGDLFHRYELFKLSKGQKMGGEKKDAVFDDIFRVAMEHQDEEIQKLFLEKLIKHINGLIGDVQKYSSWNNLHEKLDFTDKALRLRDLKPSAPKSLSAPPQEHPTPYTLNGFEVYFCKTETSEEIEDLTKNLKNLPGDKDHPTLLTLDCEFQAKFVSNCQNKVALLQFATADTVYLVDCHSMDNKDIGIRNAWKTFLEAFFTNHKIWIFGLGLHSDFIQLEGSFPDFATMKKKTVIHCETLIKRLDDPKTLDAGDKTIIALKHAMKGNSIGLETVYNTLFKKKTLDKGMQQTAFDQRPLRKEQMDYAAMDVISLHEIFNKIKECVVKRQDDKEKFEALLKKLEGKSK